MLINLLRKAVMVWWVPSDNNRSSFRVPDPARSMAGKRRCSATLRSSTNSMFPVPLNSSKITWSPRPPVSTRHVASMVRDPGPSTLRAVPKIRLGQSRAMVSIPPDMVRPPVAYRRSLLKARPSRVNESTKNNTSSPASRSRRARA